MQITLIAAIGQNRELGYENQLLWHLPGDLPRFKELTSGHAIVMGRKTFDSIGKPLPNRKNIVLSRDTSLEIEGAEVVDSIDKAIAVASQDNSKLFVIGGGEIYTLFLPIADVLELTLVDDAPEQVDAFFPEYPLEQFSEINRQTISNNEPNFSYVTYQRTSET